MNKHIYVKDQYRTNPLSLTPGGHEVTVKYSDGVSQTYDKVKNPQAFVSRIGKVGKKSRKIASVMVDGKPFSWL